MTNPNLALTQICVTFPVDDDFSLADYDVQYTADEANRLEAYGVVATATVFLKSSPSYYETLELNSSIWAVTVFPEDRSYLGECALEQVRELRFALEALGVALPAGDLPFYEVHEPGDRKPLISPSEAFASVPA